MLSLLSPAEAATPTRALTCTGTPHLRCRVADLGVRSVEAAIGRPAAAAVVFPRPRPQASTAAVFSGNSPSKNQSNQEKSGQKYTHTTPIAAAGGGAVGPHPARDPV
jgi:hypothetical protein